MSIDVLVIGAGLAGLTAADRLRMRGWSVKVLEARDRVGGRTYTSTLGDAVVDFGGQWVGPTQERAYGLIRELGVTTYPQYRRGKNLLELGGKLRSYRGWLPKISPLHLIDLWLAFQRIDRMARTLDLDAPTAHRHARAWDSMSLADWMARYARTSGARKILEIASLAILACEPRDVSLLYVLYYVRSAGGFARLAEVDGGAQQERIRGGAQQLSEGLAARLPGDVLLSAPVAAVEQSEARVTARLAGDASPSAPLADGSLSARRAVLAVPPYMASQVEFRPALPERRVRLHTSMPMGSVIKCLIQYEQPFWRQTGFSGEALSDRGPVRLVFDGCPPDASHGMLVAFVAGDEAKRFSELDRAARERAVIDSLVRFFGPEAARPTAYGDKDWVADEWSGGCYVGHMPPGVMSEVSAALRAPCDRLHFAGTETATRWIGYMDGAIESGLRAADEVDEALRRE